MLVVVLSDFLFAVLVELEVTFFLVGVFSREKLLVTYKLDFDVENPLVNGLDVEEPKPFLPKLKWLNLPFYR